VGNNPNSAYEKDFHFRIPKTPRLRNASALAGANTNIATSLGPLGLALSNVALFGPATGPNGGDAGVAEVDTFDCSNSHSSPDGSVHYHILPFLLETSQPPITGTKHSPLLGVLIDGFPIYGPNGDNGLPPTDLDACGGHSGDGTGLGYHYHTRTYGGVVPGPGNEATTQNHMPYFAGCFSGCIADSGEGSVAQKESYAQCVAHSSPAPQGSKPTYAGDYTLLEPPSPIAYNYSGCPASFATTWASQWAAQQPTSAADNTALSALVIVAAGAVIVALLS
jgi:hypothetical protein